jgi:hypothetical protein
MSGIIGGIKGAMKKKNVAVAAGVDPYWNNVTLLLNGNSLTDLSSSPKSVTVSGSAAVNTSTKKFGTGSYYFDGSSHLVIPGGSHFDFGAGDFTIEFWLNLSSISGSWAGGYLTTWHTGGANSNNGWSISSSNNSSFDISFGGMWDSSTNYGMSGVSLSSYANTWVHYAVVRSGATLTQYLNGTASNTYNIGTTPIYYPSTEMWVGAWGSGFNGINGYMDDIRITKGVARYTANFTAPTSAFPVPGTDSNWSNVVLMLTGDNLLDRSSSPKTITTYGNTSVSTTTKKYGTGSIYFDGNGDYLTFPADSSLALGTGDFTVEFWIYNTGNTNPIVNGVMCSAANTSIWTYYTGAWQITFGGTGNSLNFGWSMSSSGNSYNGSTSVTIPTNIWSHVAFTRVGTTLKTFLNGTLSATDTLPSNFNFTTDGLFEIGKHDGRSDYYLNGYLDDIRITKGVSRYPTNFGPPTSALPVPAVAGQQAYTSPGSYSWVAPAGVTSVSVVAVGGGSGSGGGGGALAYRNNIAVTPGSSYTVVVGAGGAGGTQPGNPGNSGYASSFTANGQTTTAGGGTATTGGAPSGYYDGGGSGGVTSGNSGYNGGGAGGYSGNGGSIAYNGAAGGAGSGGGGAAGDWAYNAGGGVGILGQGASGTSNGQGGSGGGNGGSSAPGGAYGGSGCGWNGSSATAGGGGAVRIIWGTGRSFPSTNTQNM